ncbi:MAG: TonB-dependent receptor [Prevotellaceae bacterium]|nr:TonB-dependent receptor [Prevotellaceae bacterium]
MERKLIMALVLMVLSLGTALAQTPVTGTVVSQDDGEPVIGATVRVVGSSNIGTVTDADGKFSLTLPSGKKELKVSYVGMEDKTVTVKAKTIRIALTSNQEALDEVIVVAYGTAKKSAFTGSAGEIKSEDISAHVTSTGTSALVGKVAGIQATSSSGEPGSAPTIRIRGIGSLNASSQPLYIVDGTPYEADIANINPNDIESISVLKDASASAIYGARGANGVVIITTKKAKKGQDAKITLDAKWGSNSRLIPQYDVISDAGEYYETFYRAMFNSQYYNGSTAAEAYAYADANLFNANNGGLDMNVYTVPDGEKLIGTNFKLNPNATLGRVDGDSYYIPDDWYDETFHSSFRQEYNVSVSGASDRLTYYASAGYLNDGGMVDNSTYQRYTSRANVEYQAKKWLKFVTNLGFTHVDSESPSYDVDTWGSSGNVFYICNMIAPIYPLYQRNADGTIKTENGRTLYTTNNGSFVGNAVRDNAYNRDQTYRDLFTGQWSAIITPIEGLNLTASLSAQSMNSRNNSLGSAFGSASSSDGYASITSNRYLTVNQQYLATYAKSFGEHNISLLAGYEQYKYKRQYQYGYNTNLFDPYIGELGNAFGTSSKSLTSYTDNYMTEGFLGRAQYDYASKYFASVSIRRDASSVFAPGHRWGTFGSIGFAWQMNKEKFLEDVKWIDLLKLKVSYGEQGNDNLSGITYAWQAYADVYTPSYDESTGQYAITMAQKGNEELTWETSKAWNFGVDFELFNRRLTGTIEYYLRNTSDLLYFKEVPLSSGLSVSSYPTNIGSVRNQGIEVSLEGAIIRTKDIDWTLNLNFTHNKNKITSLDVADSEEGLKYSNRIIKVGGTVYNAYMVKYAGTDKTNGKALYYMDVTDDDGNVTGQTTTDDITEATQYDCGTTLPDFVGGFGTSFSAYGFDLSAQFSFQLGGKIYDGTYQALMHNGLQAGQAMHKDLLNAWSPENPTSDIPRLSLASTDDAGFSSQTAQDRFLTSSNYLALNNLTLGYTLPKSITRPLELEGVRIYVSGENLFLLTKRKGLDPRFNYGIGGMTSGSGLASGGYAAMRTITAGITLNF